ncbi:linear amide C-N hydrolase [Hoyosella altamirensis]|uniref:linear amide C-N hydrolase n=1 Tax=Hoyosella altamirensis TaxID=616997 RepID=UPI0007DAEB52|nr:linear amide C-N hydrolase [Hoyosella altamirensis]
MCTRALWTASGHGVLVGRNMDWREEMDTNLWVSPRGVQRVGHGADANPLTWTAGYGSVVAAVWDMAASDGVNEAGLAAHLLWLAESDYGERDASRPALAVSLWAQLFLDTCATVDECLKLMEEKNFQIRSLIEPRSQLEATVHLALDDRSGDSAIIQYVDGSVHVYHDPTHTVMTNSPPFDEQLKLRQRYEGFGGTEPLPGTTEAADRFVRASYYLDRLPPAETRPRAYAALLSVMRNAAQPFGEPDPLRPNISATIWRTLADLTEGVYLFESSFSPNIVWTKVGEIDFTVWQKLDLSAEGLIGNVTSLLGEAEPMEFTTS